jgi:hypothetical protein
MSACSSPVIAAIRRSGVTPAALARACARHGRCRRPAAQQYSGTHAERQPFTFSIWWLGLATWRHCFWCRQVQAQHAAGCLVPCSSKMNSELLCVAVTAPEHAVASRPQQEICTHAHNASCQVYVLCCVNGWLASTAVAAAGLLLLLHAVCP